MARQLNLLTGILEPEIAPPEYTEGGNRRHRPEAKGYAAPPGTGPQGETCGSCGHIWRTESGTGKRFYKCDLYRKTHGRWTHGRGSDVLKGAAACMRWKPESERDTQG